MSGRAGAERARAVTVRDLVEMKRRGEEIVALAPCGYLSARASDELGEDVAVVGDSLGRVIPGLPSTLPVTFEHTIRHASPVRPAVRRARVVVGRSADTTS